MPRPASTTDALVADLSRRLERLVETARKEGREDALAEVRSLVGGDRSSRAGPARRKSTTRKAAKPKKQKKPRKNSWAGLTPEQRLARVNAIRKGRGLPPKKEL